MLILFLAFVGLVVYAKIAARRRPKVFTIIQRTKIACGCVLVRDEVSGKGDIQPCAAHRLMAETT